MLDFYKALSKSLEPDNIEKYITDEDYIINDDASFQSTVIIYPAVVKTFTIESDIYADIYALAKTRYEYPYAIAEVFGVKKSNDKALNEIYQRFNRVIIYDQELRDIMLDINEIRTLGKILRVNTDKIVEKIKRLPEGFQFLELPKLLKFYTNKRKSSPVSPKYWYENNMIVSDEKEPLIEAFKITDNLLVYLNNKSPNFYQDMIGMTLLYSNLIDEMNIKRTLTPYVDDNFDLHLGGNPFISNRFVGCSSKVDEPFGGISVNDFQMTYKNDGRFFMSCLDENSIGTFTSQYNMFMAILFVYKDNVSVFGVVLDKPELLEYVNDGNNKIYRLTNPAFFDVTTGKWYKDKGTFIAFVRHNNVDTDFDFFDDWKRKSNVNFKIEDI